VIQQILGHGPLIHQIPTGWNANHAPGWLREPCSAMDKRHWVQTKDRYDNGTNGKGWGSRNSRAQALTQSHSRREGVKEPEDSALTQAHAREGRAHSPALSCHPVDQPLPHIYVCIRCMSEFGRYRRFAKLMKIYSVEYYGSTNCAGSKRF
jgi:hypothetical protein